MTSDLRIQGEVVVNSEQAEGAFNRVGDKAQQMANTVATSAGKAGQAVDKIGDGAGASAEKFTRAESRISASIKRATNELELLGKTASQRLEFNIADKGLDAAKFEPALKKLREVEAQALQAQRAATGSLDKMGISAAQTAAALRGVPAQFTDIITSLQGGQAPLTVLLQQGGQLKDMFGGAGNAARALSGYVLGLVNPFTIAAAAVVGLGIAMSKLNSADAEMAGLSTRLLATGRAAVSGVSDIKSMVEELNKVPGVTKSAARSIIDEFSRVQGVSGQIFKSLGDSVADFAAATGTTLPEAAKRLATAFADPAKGVDELEKALGTLSAEQILTIRQMAEMGDKAGAQAALLDALKMSVGGLASGPMTDLGRATDNLSNAWDGLMTSVSQSSALREANAALSDLIDGVTWLLKNAPSKEMFVGPWSAAFGVGGLGRSIGGAVRDMFTTPQGGSGRGAVNPPMAVPDYESDAQLKAALDATKGIKSQAAALQELRDKSTMARAALKELEGQNKGNSAAAVELRGRIAGLNEQIEAAQKKGGAAGAAAAKAEQTAYAGLVSGIRASIDAKRLELAGGDKLTESKRLQFKVDQELLSGKLKLSDAHKAKVKDDIEELAVLERAILADKQRLQTQTAIAEQAAQAQQELAQYHDRMSREYLAQTNAANEALRAAQESSDIAALEAGLIGASNKERQTAIEYRRIELKLAREIEDINKSERTDDEKARLRAIRERAAALEKEGVALKSNMSEQQDILNSIDRTAQQVWTNVFEGGQDAFTKLGKTLKAAVLDMLYQMTIKKWIISVGASVTGTAATAGGGSSGLGGLGNIASGIGSLFGGGGMGSVLDLFGATGMGALDIGGIGLGSLGSSLASGFASIAGALGPIALGIGAVMAIVKSLDKSGTPHGGALAEYSAAGGLSTSQKHGAFGMGFGGVDPNETIKSFVGGLSTSIVGILDSVSKAFGGKGGFSVATGFADDSSKDGAWGGLLIKQMENVLVNWNDSRSSKWAPKVFADGEAGQKEYLAALAKDVTGVLKEMDLPGWAQDALNALGETPAIEDLAKVIDSINATKAVFDTLGKNLVGFSGYADDATTALLKAAGGTEALAAAASTYYENYYSEAERQANATRDVTEALAKVNIALPTSREEYRKLVEQYTAMGADGADTLAVLLGLSGAFAAITPAGEAAAATVEELIAKLRNPTRSAEDIARNTVSLEDKLFQTENKGNTAALREREQMGLSENEKAILRRIYAIEDETAAAEKAAAKAAQIASERTSLEDQWLSLIGDSAAIRERERAALDETNRALYDQIQAERDRQAAAEEAAAKAAQIASERTSLEDQWLSLIGDSAAIRKRERDALDETNRAIYDQIQAEKDRQAAAEAAAQKAAQIASERTSLEDQWLALIGDSAAIRERERAALDETNRALYDQIQAERDRQAAAEEAAAKAAQIASERTTLEEQLLTLLGKTDELRAREREKLDESNRAIYDRIKAIEDERNMLAGFGISVEGLADVIRDGLLGRLSKEDVGAKMSEMVIGGIYNSIAQSLANEIASTFISSIITPVITSIITGGSIANAISAGAIDAVVAKARAAAEVIGLIINDPDFKKAIDAIRDAIGGIAGGLGALGAAPTWDGDAWARANEAAYLAAQEAKKAWKGVGETIADEVKRLRGEIVGDTPQSLAEAQARFAIATAQARAGDQNAAASLPALSKALEDIAKREAASSLELWRIQTATAASLEMTAKMLASKFGFTLPSFAVGTNYVPQDMVAQIHKGEAIVPAAFNPMLGGVSHNGGNVELVAEVRALRQQVAELQATADKTERNTKRASDDLDDFSRNGMPTINQPGTTLATV